ncbi:MAG: lantibiotic dehydratase C-terminal domain-containing protein [Saprospiraceae bacterium]
MALRTTAKWLAVSLYYGEPWEEFLIKAVKPYADVVLQTGVAERFYFERSWEKGPNIRLWFKGNPYILAKMLRPNLDEHFLQYFESLPSQVSAPNYPEDFPQEYKWHPNNSIHYTNYSPALDLFGGNNELSIMERQYQASSMLALKTIKEKAARWTYNEMVSTAIKFHLGLAYAVGMDLLEANHFFNYLSDNWFSANYPHQRPEQSRAEFSFAKIFSLQRKDTVPYHIALWELFKRYESMDDPQFIDWIKVNANVSMEISIALDNQKLKPKKPTLSFSNTHPKTWDYFESLIKLTNNRLGIFNKNEGYLFYTLAESLKVATAESYNYRRARV